MAGITYLDAFTKPALRGLVDETLRQAVPTFADRFLPTEETYDMKFAYDIVKTHRYIASVIGYGAEAPIVDRNELASMSGEIAKIALKDIVTEEELLKIHQARNSGERQSTIDRILLRGVDLVEAVQRRIDVMKIEALTKGKLEYNKNGVKFAVDFGIPAENKVALTSGNDWTNTEHDVIGDLLTWTEQYEDMNGEAPSLILLSREAQAQLLKNAVIVAEARGANSGATRVSVDELNSVLGGYDLPPVQVVSDRKFTVKNLYTGQQEVIEFFPKNRVVMLSEGVGSFLLGPTVENDFQPGITLIARDEDEPIRSILKAVAAGFPAIEQPSRIFHADVFTA